MAPPQQPRGVGYSTPAAPGAGEGGAGTGVQCPWDSLGREQCLGM